MSFEPDAILDRRRLRRNLSLWRIAAITGLAAALAILAADYAGVPFGRDHISTLEVTGIIVGDEERDQAILDLAKDSHSKALIVTIDSPGGTTSGSESLYLALREVARKKPVVAVMGTVAASGGYITAIGADHIIARGNTITGSIGVLMQNTEVSKLLEKIGVGIELITSGPLKGKPSPFEPLDARGRAAIQTLIDDSYQWFVGLVAERRNLTLERARELADGRVFSGRLALEARLIDEIGGMPEARQWLDKRKAVPEKLPLEPVAYGEEDVLPGRLIRNMVFGFAEKSLDLKRLTL
ncbi:MAG: signal peptide peptidase SppA, partial [Alphaproteobacteria bacterium]|nr:signal peptide peptidase SppA [Alphaproteobacteria bacterium]